MTINGFHLHFKFLSDNSDFKTNLSTNPKSKNNPIFESEDAFINRIAKHIFADQFNLEKSTYYVLDATGNVMATYDKEIDYTNSEVYLKLKDRSIYGSSRVGVRSTDIDMLALHNPNYSMKSVKYEIGKRTYELSNHLGNVLSVISDKPIPSFEHEELVGMLADVRVAQDYSPFGVTLSGRDFMLEGAERGKFGFNGMEADNEVKGNGNSYDFGARMLDPRLGRWLSIDPHAEKYSGMSSYNFVGNNPIIAIDPDGKEIIIAEFKDEKTGKTKLRIELSGKVIFDYLSTIKSPEKKQEYVDNLNSELTKFYSKQFENIEVEFISKMSMGSESCIEEKDHVIYSVNLHTGPESKGFPRNVGGFVAGIVSKKAFFPFNTMDYSTAIHEVGHWLGLNHPKTTAINLSKYKLLNSETLGDKKYDFNDVMGEFSGNNFMHHTGDTKTSGKTKTGSFDEIQAKIMQAVSGLGGLNKGSNKKEGTPSEELNNAPSNSIATGVNNIVVGNQLDSKSEKK